MNMIAPQQIKQEELHVWWVNLRDFELAVPALWPVLSPLEQARAERHRSLRDKDKYIIRHGMLRMLLATYLRQAPSSFNFTIGDRGKPALRTRLAAGPLHFDTSHSGDVVLYSFTSNCPVGVEVEFLQPVRGWEQIAREVFSQSEAESLMALPDELRFKRFFYLWTRKEALLKATGDGWGIDREASFGFLPRPESSRAIGAKPASGTSAEWHVRSFLPVPGYVAAVAFQDPDLSVICRCAPGFFSGELGCPGRFISRNPSGI